MESHLLQMRGLKHRDWAICCCLFMSHLLQMRGLKLFIFYCKRQLSRRIFYRCVD